MKLHVIYLGSVMALTMVVPNEPVSSSEPVSPNQGCGGDPPPAFDVKLAAQRVDKLLEADMKRAKIEPNAIAGDATFVRRAYLGIVGRIPSMQETLQFLNSQEPDKRGRLVDALLDSPGHDSHMFNFWADLLRVKSRMNNQVSGEPFAHYIKESIAANKPYDDFVREMLTASGAANARGSGATGMLLRDRGMPLDSMANTVRVFLGTRLECAQCHNHPFDKWKQKDFFAMAAFTGGLDYRANVENGAGNDLRRLFVELRQSNDRQGTQALGRILRNVNTGISGTGTGVIRLPKDYKYDDAQPNQVVKAHAMFGDSPKIAYPEPRTNARSNRRQREADRRRPQRPNADPTRVAGVRELDTRAAYAEWLTSPKNPRFALVIANRMWKEVMGRGLIEPVDNLMDDTVASNPALMKYLEKLMVDVDFDLKKFQRVLFNTTAFRREATHTDVPSDQKYFFQGPVLRRMTAEQMWDSMLTLVVPDLDAKLLKPDVRANLVYANYERTMNMSEDDLRKEIEVQKLRATNPQKFRDEQRRRQQQMQEERRKVVMEEQRQNQERQRKAADLRRQAQPIYRELIKARRAKDKGKVAELEAKLKEMGVEPDQDVQTRREMAARLANQRGRGRGGDVGALLRASDLPQPAPNNHFLHKFGQSDREQIDAAHTEANVPQVLSLLNGFIEDQVIANRGSVLMRSIENVSASKEQVRLTFLGVLNREPRGRESAVWEHELETGASKIADLVWTLANTHEFRFIQ